MRKAIYREDGGKFMVYVLSDETRKENGRERREVRMRVHVPLIIGPMQHHMRKDYEFTASSLEGYEQYLNWSLDYLPEVPPRQVDPIYSGPTATERDEQLCGGS